MKPQDQCFSITPPPWVDALEALRPEINLQPTETDGKQDDQIINCGYVPVVLSKMFGPLIFADIRIRADSKSREWVIERGNANACAWQEVARIAGQKPEDFEE